MRKYLVVLLSLSFWFFISSCYSSPVLAQEGKNYAVVVMGGEPEGVTAAVSAARRGLPTLLICSDKILGGTMTLADLNSIDMNYGPRKEILTQGLFMDFFKAMGGDSFDLSKARKYFHDLAAFQKNLTVRYQAKLEKTVLDKDGKSLVALVINQDGKEEIIYGKRFIDATADGDLAALSGVPYTIGREDLGQGQKVMASTLVFQVGGVKWEKISNYLNNGGKEYLTGANQWSAWGYGQEMKGYQPSDSQMKLRGLNIGRQEDGSVLINALLIFDVNPLDPSSVEKGLIRGKKEVGRVVDYLRQKAVGFEEAYLIDSAQKLYIRESRHIQGEYILTIDDVLENRMFPDRIALASYPVDVQAASKNEGGVSFGAPLGYSIPFRSLVPLKIENLLVVGRSASYTSLAAGSARVIPVGMVEGESAGFAAVYSIRTKMNFRKLCQSPLDIRIIQDGLIKQGGYLPYLYLPDPSPDRFHWTYPYMKILRKKGIVEGGYENRYYLEEQANPQLLINLLRSLLLTLPQSKKSPTSVWELVKDNYHPLDYREAIGIMNLAYKNYRNSRGEDDDSPLTIDKEVEQQITQENVTKGQTILNRGQIMALATEFIKNIDKENYNVRKNL